MKSVMAPVLVALAALSACGGKDAADVRFIGFTPNTITQKPKDARDVKIFCSHCGKPLNPTKPNLCTADLKQCKTKIQWEQNYNCGFCGGTGKCNACANMEQDKGKCYNCKGLGYLAYVGDTSRTPAVICPNCKGESADKAVCPICQGKQECDYCKGAGKLSKDEILSRVKTATGVEDEDSPAKPPDAKDTQKP